MKTSCQELSDSSINIRNHRKLVKYEISSLCVRQGQSHILPSHIKNVRVIHDMIIFQVTIQQLANIILDLLPMQNWNRLKFGIST